MSLVKNMLLKFERKTKGTDKKACAGEGLLITGGHQIFSVFRSLLSIYLSIQMSKAPWSEKAEHVLSALETSPETGLSKVRCRTHSPLHRLNHIYFNLYALTTSLCTVLDR